MLQRAMIAMALCCDPRMVIADEPTSSLDVTTQAQILRLMRDLQEKFGTSLLLITHNMGVVAEMADEVAVMYSGRIVERAKTEEILKSPRHPYTVGLLKCIPRLNVKERLESIPGVQEIRLEDKGCSFTPRCKKNRPDCKEVIPDLQEVTPGHYVACTQT
jgi:peptide/nickel transport system ATP-binding protein/oligopeptide transport system ATP-binding protein